MAESTCYLIGENDHGYQFAVERTGMGWIGFAVGTESSGRQSIYYLPGCVSAQLQIMGDDETVRDEIIKRVGAIANNPEKGYGGISRWFVPAELRGRPQDFICKHCGEVCCDEWDHQDGGDLSFDEAANPDEPSFDFGTCCTCEGSENVRNIIMLDLKSPSGKGWGCFQCGLSMEGAFAVVCDNCLECEIKFVTGGLPDDKTRVPIRELRGEHKHDLSKHPEEIQR